MIRDALDREDRRSRSPMLSRRAWVAGALAAAAATLLVVWLRRRPELREAVAADFVAYRDGDLVLAFRTSEPARLESHFADGGVAFATRVFDLGMMRYELQGGTVHRLAGRISALYAYRGLDGTPLVCQMFEGSASDLPATADVREQRGTRFHVVRAADITLVFWVEEGVVCVLASDGAAERIVELALAKARA